MKEDNNKKILIQPKMRFKPRSDIERVLETINNYSFGRISESILKNVQKNTLKEAFSKTSEKYFSFHNLGKKNKSDKSLLEVKSDDNFNFNKNVEERPTYLKKNIKKIHKSDSKSFLKELHYKTHFKAATDFTNFNSIFFLPRNRCYFSNLNKPKFQEN